MLNACRRQRSVHQIAPRIPWTVSPVLNACRRQRSVHTSASPASRPCLICAQRLSASKIGSHEGSCHRRPRGDVLNACRRQRSVHLSSGGTGYSAGTCSTPVGVKDRFTKILPAIVGCKVPCSTPVGVKDRFTNVPYGSCVEAGNVLNACRRQRSVHRTDSYFLSCRFRVLNACRRQRSVHAQRCKRDRAGLVCSTPVGVKDRFTTSRRRS